MAQVTYVEPYFDTYELRERVTVYEKNFNIGESLGQQGQIWQMGGSHRHLNNIDCLTACTACLVSFFSTV
jgi:hypothetical protein